MQSARDMPPSTEKAYGLISSAGLRSNWIAERRPVRPDRSWQQWLLAPARIGKPFPTFQCRFRLPIMNNRSEPGDRAQSPDEPIGLAPADATDPLIEAFKKDIDRTLLIENLRVSSQERSQRFLRGMQSIYELRRAGQRHRTAVGRDAR
jgi:hypothetical protein